MKVNIFLKQFKCSNEGLVSLIKEGRAEQINATKLKGLLKILPEKEEVCRGCYQIQSYSSFSQMTICQNLPKLNNKIPNHDGNICI